MNYSIEIKRLPNSEIEIRGEVSAADFESARKGAVKEIGLNLKIEGFRPGNVPEKVIVEKFGEGIILEKMAEITLQKLYPQIVEKEKIKPIGRPEIVITKIAPNNPLGFVIKTAVLPEVELPDYKEIASKINKEKIEGEDEEKIRQARRVKILEKIIEESKMDVPKVLIDAEKLKMFGEMRYAVEQMGMSWSDYLNNVNKTEEQILNEFEKDALKRVQYGLVLNKIAESEDIKVEEEEMEKELEKVLKSFPEKQNLDLEKLKLYLYDIIQNEKVFNFLEQC